MHDCQSRWGMCQEGRHALQGAASLLAAKAVIAAGQGVGEAGARRLLQAASLHGLEQGALKVLHHVL